MVADCYLFCALVTHPTVQNHAGAQSMSGGGLRGTEEEREVLLHKRKVLGAIRRYRAVWWLRLGDGHHDRQQQGPLLPLLQEEHVRQGHLRHEQQRVAVILTRARYAYASG